jgi:hypothetical protein
MPDGAVSDEKISAEIKQAGGVGEFFPLWKLPVACCLLPVLRFFEIAMATF